MHMNRRTRKGLLESHLGFDHLRLQLLLLVVPHASNPTSPLTPRRCALRDRHCLRRQPSRQTHPSSASHPPIWLLRQGCRIPGLLFFAGQKPLIHPHHHPYTPPIECHHVACHLKPSAVQLPSSRHPNPAPSRNFTPSGPSATDTLNLAGRGSRESLPDNDRVVGARGRSLQLGVCRVRRTADPASSTLIIIIITTPHIIQLCHQRATAPYGIGHRIHPAQSLYR